MESESIVLMEREKPFLSVMQYDVQNRIVSIRGCDVIADADVAELYGGRDKEGE